MIASYHGLSHMVRRLLTVPNIQVNAANYFGYTALMHALYTSHSDIIQNLLSAGAQVKYTFLGKLEIFGDFNLCLCG